MTTGLVTFGLAAPSGYILTDGLGPLALSPAGWADDWLRDPHLVGTILTGSTTGFSQWHPQATDQEAILYGLFNLGPRFGMTSGFALQTSLADLAYKNLDLTILQVTPPGPGVPLAVQIWFDPSDVNWPVIKPPDQWTAQDIASFLDNWMKNGLGLIPGVTYWQLTGSGDGKLIFRGGDVAAGNPIRPYIRIDDTSDPWILDILGFYANQLAYAPQAFDIRFDHPGSLAYGLELRAQGDSHYAPISNRYLLNISEDLKTLRREILHLRDGIYGDSEGPADIGLTGTKRLQGHFSITPTYSLMFEANQVSNSSNVAINWFSHYPDGSSVSKGPVTITAYDSAGLGGVSALITKFHYINDVSTPNAEDWLYMVVAENEVGLAANSPIFVLGNGMFYYGGVTHSGPATTQFDTYVQNAIIHYGAIFSTTVYNPNTANFVPDSLYASCDEFQFNIDDSIRLNIVRNALTIDANSFAVTLGSTRFGGVAVSTLFNWVADYTASNFSYDFGFQAGSPSLIALQHTMSNYTGYITTTNGNGVRYSPFAFTRQLISMGVEDLAGTTRFATSDQARLYTEFYAESSLAGAQSTFLWSVDGFVRAEFENNHAAAITPYALRLNYVAPNQTQLVFQSNAATRTLIQWSESNPELWRTVVGISPATGVGFLQNIIASWSPIFPSYFSVTTPSVSLLKISEFPIADQFDSLAGQTITIGHANDRFKAVLFNNPGTLINDYSSIVWDIQKKRPRASVVSSHVGALTVHRGGAGLRELNGELVDYYRVFTPNDYWWDIAEAITDAEGDIELDGALGAVPSYAAPIEIRTVDNDLFVGVAVANPGANTYRYILEGHKVLISEQVYDFTNSGAPLNVVSIDYQRRGTILLKSGAYYPRHRIYCIFVYGSPFSVNEEVVAWDIVGADNVVHGHGWVAEVGVNYIDLINCTGRFSVGSNIDEINGVGGSGTITSVVMPIPVASAIDISNPVVSRTRFHRENAEIRVIGEKGTVLMGHAGFIGIKTNTSTEFSYKASQQKRRFGTNLGLTFENIIFGGNGSTGLIPPPPYTSVVYNEHGIVFYEKGAAANLYFYGLKFQNCEFYDRLVWFNDETSFGSGLTGRWNLSLEVDCCTFDAAYFQGLEHCDAYLVDMSHDKYDYGSWNHYDLLTDFNRLDQIYGPCIIESRFSNIRVISDRINPVGSVVPYKITSLVNVEMENVSEENLGVEAVPIYNDSLATCEYFQNVDIHNCNFPEKIISLGKFTAIVVYDSTITGVAGRPVIGDSLVFENGIVGVIEEFRTTTVPDDTVLLTVTSAGTPWDVVSLIGNDLTWVITSWLPFIAIPGWLGSDAGTVVLSADLYCHPVDGCEITQNNIGRIAVSGSWPVAGDLNTYSYGSVVVDHNRFTAQVIVDAALSPVSAVGAVAHFTGLNSVKFTNNIAEDVYWETLTANMAAQKRAYSILVTYKGCGEFKAHGNIWGTERNTFNSAAFSGLPIGDISREGTSMYVYSGYLTTTAKINSDEATYLSAGNGWFGSASVNECNGGDFIFAHLCCVLNYKIKDNTLNNCQSGFAAGASNSSIHSGNFGVAVDVPWPADNIELVASSTGYNFDFKVGFNSSQTLKITGQVDKNNLINCFASDGVGIGLVASTGYVQEGWIGLSSFGNGGNFFGARNIVWTNDSGAKYTTKRSWNYSSFSDNKLFECYAGSSGGPKPGSLPLGDYHGANGGNFKLIEHYINGTSITKGLHADRNELIASHCGDGINGYAPLMSAKKRRNFETDQRPQNGGNGGDFNGIYLGTNTGIGNANYFMDISTDENNLVEVLSGSGGAGSFGGTSGIAGDWLMLDLNLHLGTVPVNQNKIEGVSAHKNQIVDSYPQRGNFGFEWISGNGLIGRVENYSIETCWAIAKLNIEMDTTETYLFGHNIVISDNKYSIRDSGPTVFDSAAFSALMFYGEGQNGPFRVMPFRNVTVKNNEKRFNDESDIWTSLILYINKYVNTLPLPNTKIENVYRWDVLVEDNNWKLNYAANPDEGRYATQHLCLPSHYAVDTTVGLGVLPKAQPRLRFVGEGLINTTEAFFNDIIGHGVQLLDMLSVPGDQFVAGEQIYQIYISDSHGQDHEIAITDINTQFNLSAVANNNNDTPEAICNLIAAIFSFIGIRADVGLVREVAAGSATFPKITITLDPSPWVRALRTANVSTFGDGGGGILDLGTGIILKSKNTMITHYLVFRPLDTTFNPFQGSVVNKEISYEMWDTNLAPPAYNTVYYRSWTASQYTSVYSQFKGLIFRNNS